MMDAEKAQGMTDAEKAQEIAQRLMGWDTELGSHRMYRRTFMPLELDHSFSELLDRLAQRFGQVNLGITKYGCWRCSVGDKHGEARGVSRAARRRAVFECAWQIIKSEVMAA